MNRFISISDIKGKIGYVAVDSISAVIEDTDDTFVYFGGHSGRTGLATYETVESIMKKIEEADKTYALEVMRKFKDYVSDKPACFNRNGSNFGADLMVGVDGKWCNAIEQFIKETYK